MTHVLFTLCLCVYVYQWPTHIVGVFLRFFLRFMACVRFVVLRLVYPFFQFLWIVNCTFDIC